MPYLKDGSVVKSTWICTEKLSDTEFVLFAKQSFGIAENWPGNANTDISNTLGTASDMYAFYNYYRQCEGANGHGLYLPAFTYTENYDSYYGRRVTTISRTGSNYYISALKAVSNSGYTKTTNSSGTTTISGSPYSIWLGKSQYTFVVETGPSCGYLISTRPRDAHLVPAFVVNTSKIKILSTEWGNYIAKK